MLLISAARLELLLSRCLLDETHFVTFTLTPNSATAFIFLSFHIQLAKIIVASLPLFALHIEHVKISNGDYIVISTVFAGSGQKVKLPIETGHWRVVVIS